MDLMDPCSQGALGMTIPISNLLWNAPPADYVDPMVEAYKRDVDVSLLRENLKLTVQERFERFDRAMEFFEELSAAGERMRAPQDSEVK
jgi:hypothetical protein